MHIDSYSFGSISVGNKTYKKDVIIFPDKVLSPWWRAEGHLLQMGDLEEVINARPSVLIVGTGASGIMKVPDQLIKALGEKGIEVMALRTPEAVAAFNDMGDEKVIAALHLTC